jgi:hypothetical protein
MIYAILIIGVYVSIVLICLRLLQKLHEQADEIRVHNERIIEYKRRINSLSERMEELNDAEQSHIK